MVPGAPGLTTIAPIERLIATDWEPATSDQLWPPSIDLNRPRPASESPEPLGSPEPAYSVLPVASFASTISEPNAFVGRLAGGSIHAGCAASASFVRQIPPPAAATQRRHGAPAGADALPQLGSIASAVTRPDSCVAGPVPVAGSKNCEASPATFGVTGPSALHAPGLAICAAENALVFENADGPSVLGFALKAS